MKRKIPKVFLSHSSKDKPIVRRIASALESKGCIVWIDEAELKIGDSLIDKIAFAIDRVDFVLAVISSHSAKSQWVRKELSLAMTKEILGKHVIVLPVLVESTELPLSLRDKLYADLRKKKLFSLAIERIYKAIVESINGKKKINDRETRKRRVKTRQVNKTINKLKPAIGSYIVSESIKMTSMKHADNWMKILKSQVIAVAITGCIIFLFAIGLTIPRETRIIALGILISGGSMLLGAISGLTGHTAMQLALSDDPNLVLQIEDIPYRHCIRKLYQAAKNNRRFIIGWWFFYIGFFGLAIFSVIVIILILIVIIKYNITLT